MRLLIISLTLLLLCACAKKVDVDIYNCPVVSDGQGPAELKEKIISCPKGKKPTPEQGGDACEKIGDGSIAASKVEIDACE